VAALSALIVILAATLYYAYASSAVPGEALPEAGWVALVFGVQHSPPLWKLCIPAIGKFRPALRSMGTTVADFIE
jgi:hypothetical protein